MNPTKIYFDCEPMVFEADGLRNTLIRECHATAEQVSRAVAIYRPRKGDVLDRWLLELDLWPMARRLGDRVDLSPNWFRDSVDTRRRISVLGELVRRFRVTQTRAN